MVGAMMAKKSAAKQPKAATIEKSGFRTIGIRVSDEYAAWLANAAKHDRVSVAVFIDKAVADRAKATGYAQPAPVRVP